MWDTHTHTSGKKKCMCFQSKNPIKLATAEAWGGAWVMRQTEALCELTDAVLF